MAYAVAAVMGDDITILSIPALLFPATILVEETKYMSE
jgi:hypothetical protein